MSSIKLLCPHCGSDDIIRDAWTRWNGHRWVLEGIYDDMTCNTCAAEFEKAETRADEKWSEQ
jgi:predicted RNA-binding Zn-ribbon protein involved in translation (DUF1610 family)